MREWLAAIAEHPLAAVGLFVFAAYGMDKAVEAIRAFRGMEQGDEDEV